MGGKTPPGRTGFVWLVGAGPGDPELLTRKAARCLRAAQVVFYDALVSRETLRLARGAQCFSVGKRAGRSGVRQQTIHALMIRAARRGKRVVRLKCGDPYLLGRGAEEALALAAAGVSFEVVPGISAALAAPALAGIPATHRGLASGLLVLSGHAPQAYAPALRSLAPGSATLVVLMGLRSKDAIASFLLERGWPSHTPAAIVVGAATKAAWSWLGSLEQLGGVNVPAHVKGGPGTIVVGAVVSLAPIVARSVHDTDNADQLHPRRARAGVVPGR